MEIKRPIKRYESAGNQRGTHRLRMSRAWQFSLRGLLLTTAFISICLAIGTRFDFLNFILFALVLVYVAILESFDWLIRPSNRRELAFATAALWAMLGSSFLVFGFQITYFLISNSSIGDAFGSAILFLMLAAMCSCSPAAAIRRKQRR